LERGKKGKKSTITLETDIYGKLETNNVILKRRHTQLALNCAMTMGDYFLNFLEDKNILTQDAP
jgi:hypothetical protein